MVRCTPGSRELRLLADANNADEKQRVQRALVQVDAETVAHVRGLMTVADSPPHLMVPEASDMSRKIDNSRPSTS
jgi:hypothetical protein